MPSKRKRYSADFKLTPTLCVAGSTTFIAASPPMQRLGVMLPVSSPSLMGLRRCVSVTENAADKLVAFTAAMELAGLSQDP